VPEWYWYVFFSGHSAVPRSGIWTAEKFRNSRGSCAAIIIFFFWLHRVHREANPAAANLHRLPFFVSPWFRKRLPRGWTSVENTGSMQSTEKQLSDVVNNTISMWNIGVIHGAGGCSEICRVRL
jgi:hypothetical protein